MEKNLRERTKQFALRIIRLYSAMPERGVPRVLGNQNTEIRNFGGSTLS
jgi:hypothetical protein